MLIAIHDPNVHRPTLGVHLTKAETKLFVTGLKEAGFKAAVPFDAGSVAKVCGVIETAAPGLKGKLAALGPAEVLCVMAGDSFDARFTRVAPAGGNHEPEPVGDPEPETASVPAGAKQLGAAVADLVTPVRIVIERMIAKAEWRPSALPPEPVLERLRAEGVAIPTHEAVLSVGPGALRCLKLADGSVIVNREDLEGFARVFGGT